MALTLFNIHRKSELHFVALLPLALHSGIAVAGHNIGFLAVHFHLIACRGRGGETVEIGGDRGILRPSGDAETERELTLFLGVDSHGHIAVPGIFCSLTELDIVVVGVNIG